MADPAGAAVAVDDLVVFRGRRQVLFDVSCAVPAGQVTGLLGPSGGGKTTLLRSIVGVQAIRSGRVGVLGLPAGDPALRARIGYVTQAPSVYADLSVRDNLRYFAALTSGTDRIPDVLAAVGLADRAADRVDQLSGGQRARVSLACALVGEPPLLVLDEPTVGLDPVLRRDLWQLFHQLAAGGATLIVSSHVMDEAARCDRLLLLREGRLYADDTPAAILRQTGAPDLEEAFLRLASEQVAR
ncbi:ABC transporter ATP-binding protein [Jatrophihabitans sp.]|uniref:ABC transporter ATP-binding protein n=1 Tax=Jatrophihabitans sp. TaxID=1932789 RepID=UPI002C3F3DE7|nr:ABC transporter ATP-binding protein [Jatrophihabitans sp.]